ncbi:MAG: YhbY family RNA-binding protein [Methanomassiliicoccus sp.]|nr:YhbY family RNA-binding protein [Methanomassiliicoccus sp.]
MPMKKSRKELVKMGSEIDPTVHVGKEGVTEGIVQEIKAQIKRAKVIKVRVLPAADQTKDEVAEELATRTGAKVVETRGFTVLMCEASLFDDKAH